MSRSLRYRQPDTRDALAAQYVAGDMTPRVRRRMEALMREDPDLADAVAHWADRMAPLQDGYANPMPPDNLWSRIEAGLPEEPEPETTPRPERSESGWSRLWHSLTLWRTAAFGGLASALVLALILLPSLFTSPSVPGADYMAPLTWEGQVALVVSGYRGENKGESWVSAQWSERLDDRPAGALYLWAEGETDRDWVFLGPITPNNRDWGLDPARWQALTHSRRLAVNQSRDRFEPSLALLEGPCIQLKSW